MLFLSFGSGHFRELNKYKEVGENELRNLKSVEIKHELFQNSCLECRPNDAFLEL